MNFKSINAWGKSPFLISGPCSAETPEQVLESCKGAKEAGAHLLRAGIWKPRTRPNSFEGKGVEALPWLIDAGKELGLPVTTEVANAAHVEAALKAGVDVLWIGARTTVSPFAVQEIVAALKGTAVPIMVKNPVSPDLELWIGALERLYQSGQEKLMAIFRGCLLSNSAPYRNTPLWGIPIELKRRFPTLPIIVDPSHIAGRRALLPELCQKTIDLEFDGWMIETHHRPEKALSDAAQQVTGEALKTMLDNLVPRNRVSENKNFLANLEALRYDIDQLDDEIIHLLGKRMEVVREIGKYKSEANTTILQMDRWKDIYEQRISATRSSGLSENFAKSFISNLHVESIHQQTEVMKPFSDKIND